jgi:hypothetical protein
MFHLKCTMDIAIKPFERKTRKLNATVDRNSARFVTDDEAGIDRSRHFVIADNNMALTAGSDFPIADPYRVTR